MSVKKQVKRIKKTVMKQPALTGMAITGVMGIMGAAGMVMSKMKKNKSLGQGTTNM